MEQVRLWRSHIAQVVTTEFPKPDALPHGESEREADSNAQQQQRRDQLTQSTDSAECIELISELEKLKHSVAALQARLGVEVDRQRHRERKAQGVPAKKRSAGVGAEIALARGESAHAGGRLLGTARALVEEMPHTFCRLAAGDLSEWRATLLVRETACLTREDRAEVDGILCTDPATLKGKGTRAVIASAKRIAYQLEPRSVLARQAKATSERYVTLRPAPDTMTYLTALLPVKEGVAVYAALNRAADTARSSSSDQRSRGQVMADTLVERITGVASTDQLPVTLNLVMTDQTLLEGGSEPGSIPGYGPIPAASARQLTAAAIVSGSQDEETRLWVRRLYTAATTGQLVAMESRARTAPAGLAELIRLRDGGTCRMPWCDAPIRHIDHIRPHAWGGPTAAANLQGLCQTHNYAKEAPGWGAESPSGQARTVRTTTPSGHIHHSHSPPVSQPGARQPSPPEPEPTPVGVPAKEVIARSAPNACIQRRGIRVTYRRDQAVRPWKNRHPRPDE